MASRRDRLTGKASGGSMSAPQPVRRPNRSRPNNPGGGNSPNRRRGRGGAGVDTSAFLDKEDAFNSYLSMLQGAGINPYEADAGYSDWLQRDAFQQYDNAYFNQLKVNPNTTRTAFNQSYAANNPGAFSRNAYMPHYAEQNKAEFYTQRANEAGLNPFDESSFGNYVGGAGFDKLVADYGAQAGTGQNFYSYLTPERLQSLRASYNSLTPQQRGINSPYSPKPVRWAVY